MTTLEPLVELCLEYWKSKWENDDAFWHRTHVNDFLVRHIHQMVPGNSSPKKFFVPLCGKSLDLKWLYDQGHEVVGLDGADKPVQEFFLDHGLAYKERNHTVHGRYFTTADGRLKIIVADLFTVSASQLGKFDCVWDRGSLVALSHEDRIRYAALMKQLLKGDFYYLVDTIVYEQSKFSGPPQSVSVNEIRNLFGDVADVKVLEEVDRNKDPKQERTPRVRWNLDVCHEVIVLLSPKC